MAKAKSTKRVTEPKSTAPKKSNNNLGLSPEQCYVMAWNLQESEFPVLVEIMAIDTEPPLSVTLTQNGLQPIGSSTASMSNRRWARVTVANPDAIQPPLIVETIVLNPAEIEPPVTTTSQYIRVVIRNYQIPQGGHDDNHH
jgi:hypothetical protein